MPERSFDSFAIVEVAVDGLLEMVVVKSFKGLCDALQIESTKVCGISGYNFRALA